MNAISFRLVAFIGFLLPTAAMAFALYLQYGLYLEPCPLCVFQRIAMIAFALVWLIATVHAPLRSGRMVYSALGAVAAFAGIAVAGRHVWLQSLPPDQVPACGPSLDYLLDIQPLQEVITTVLRGDGNCAIVDAAFLGISLPAWTLVTFVGLSLFSLVAPRLARS